MRKRLAVASDDFGMALVMTLMIMSVGAIIITTLVIVTVFNTGFSAKSRADMRVLASADSGIDMIMGLLDGKTYADLSTVCGPMNYVINNDTVVVTTKYEVVSGTGTTTTTCPTSSQITRTLTVQSTATSTNVPVANEIVSRTVEAVLYATPEEVPLDKAIFSEATTTVTSNTTIQESTSGAKDAFIYTNGGFNCETQDAIEGSIYAAHGDVYFKNDCDIKLSVWASGTVMFDSGTVVDGDVYSASTADPAINIQNTNAEVLGSIISNGSIKLDAEVGGNVVSLANKIDMYSKTVVTKNAHAALKLTMNNGALISGNAASNTEIATTNDNKNKVTGTATAPIIGAKLTAGSKVIGTASRPSIAGLPAALGYPTEVVAPPREQFPYLTMNADDIALWQADGYKVTETTACDSPAALNAINSADYGDQGKALVIFKGCTKPVYFAQHSNLSVKGNLGLVSTSGFHVDNQVDIATTVTGTRPELVWMVPADSPNITWGPTTEASQTTPVCTSTATRTTSTGVTQDLYFQKFKVKGVDMFAYTPCEFQQDTGWDTNSDPWTGQIYSGTVDLHNSFDMQMSTIGIPSNADKTPALTKPANMQLISRYDLFN
ncbi:hypothetical protein [Demequina maris]|uniref:hypothetical protein n=1 Tax=Demequina maris TaxID=1638982 RepID=UPI0012E00D60|nr:hypothetical protein [Demequina maris]